MQISVVGLGKLGAPLAAVFASKGFSVIGTDLNRDYVDAINDGTAPVDEPRLAGVSSTRAVTAPGDDRTWPRLSPRPT